MKNNWKYYFGVGLLSIVFLLTSITTIKATHIVGGEINYRCLGNNEYEVSLTVFRDCFYGDPTAFFDDPAIIGVFDGVTNNLISTISIPYDEMTNDTLNEVLTDTCLVVGPDLCVHSAIYRDTVQLMQRQGGYLLAYQRCCRNQTILNIVNPVGTGGTYTTYISETALVTCNSAAAFKEWPPLFVCVAEPINWDHSAIDLDGDSLVYKFCAPLSGATLEDPEPKLPSNPPYDPIVWKAPYSVDNLLGGDPILEIDAQTGFITGLPGTGGQFVVGVCVDEYRDGLLISSTRRDFQYNVGQCIPTKSIIENHTIICDNLQVNFNNKSTNSSSYIWDFGDLTTDGDTSHAKNPTYIYPDTGHYLVRLISEPYSICSDTLYKEFWLKEATVRADFTFLALKCDSIITVGTEDISIDGNDEIVSWEWSLSDGQKAYIQNPSFVTNAINDSLTLTLVAYGSNGCPNTISKKFAPTSIAPLGLIDAKNICLGDSLDLVTIPIYHEDYTYNWSPKEVLDDPTVPNPVGFPTMTTTYSVTITHIGSGCSNVFEKEVKVNDISDIRIDATVIDTETNSETELTDISVVNNCENEVTTLKFINTFGVTNIVDIKWYDENGNLIGGDPSITVDPDSFAIFTIQITDTMGCVAFKEIQIQGNPVDIFVKEETLDLNNDNKPDLDINGDGIIDICIGTPFILHVINNIPTDTLTYAWTGDVQIISQGGDTANPILEPIETGIFTLYANITNQYGCEFVDTVLISVADPLLDPDFQIYQNCTDLDIEFRFNNANYLYYTWDLGDPVDPSIITGLTEFSHIYSEGGIYTVTLTPFQNFECELQSFTKEIVIYPLDLGIEIDATGVISGDFEIDVANDTITSCEEEIIHITTSSTKIDTAIYDIKWYNQDGDFISDTEIHVEPNGSKTYKVIYTNPLGCVFEKSIVVEGGTVETKITGTTITGPGGNIVGVTNPDGSVDLCLGSSYLLVSENLHPGDILTYEWYTETSVNIDGSNTSRPVLTPSKAGNFDIFVSITNQYGCEKKDTLLLHVVDPNTILDFEYFIDCDGLRVHFINVQHNDEDVIWTFIKGVDTVYSREVEPTIYFDGVGLYPVTLAVDANVGCVDPRTKIIEIVDPILKSDFSYEYKSCNEDELTIQFFNESINPQNNTESIHWDFGVLGTSQDPNPILTIDEDQQIAVTLTIVTSIGCNTVSDTVRLDLNLIDKFDWEDQITFCTTSDTITLNEQGTDSYLYEWSPGYGLSDSTIYNPKVLPIKSMIYDVMVTDTSGTEDCQFTRSMEINIPTFTLELRDTVSVCRNIETELNPDSQGDDSYEYLWSPDLLSDSSVKNPLVVSDTSIWFDVQIMDKESDCIYQDSVFLDIPAPINLGIPLDTVSCEAFEAILTATADVHVKYTWANDPDFNNIVSTRAAVNTVSSRSSYYYVEAVDDNNCIERDSVKVEDYHVEVELRKKYAICVGDSVELNVVNLLATDQLEYQWEGPELLASSSNIFVAPIQTTLYFSDVTNQYGCSQKDSILVRLKNEEPLFSDITASPDTIYKGKEALLEVVEGYSYEWDPPLSLSDIDIYNPVAFPEETTEYTVTITDDEGCDISRLITVFVLNRICDEPFIFFPNAFSPNNDGENDELQLHGNDLDEVYWVIYNRWGEKVFEANSAEDKWDGRFKGELVAPDVYGFYLKTKCFDGELFEKKGNVTVLK